MTPFSEDMGPDRAVGGLDDVEVRPVVFRDMPAVARIHLDTLSDTAARLLGPEAIADFYVSQAALRHAVFLVALAGGEIVGFVAGFPEGEESAGELAQMKRKLKLTLARRLATRPWWLLRMYRPIVHRFFFMMQPRRAAEGRYVLSPIAVTSDRRRRGVGKRLLLAFAGEVRARGFQCIYLETKSHGNEAVLRFYRDLGFRDVSEAGSRRHDPMTKFEADVESLLSLA